jgi:GT2 family glycosyltransferase
LKETHLHATVVIPAYNARASLETCLASLDLQRLPGDDEFDVVVVDDGSDDGTAELVPALSLGYEIRYEFIPRTETSGRARARNRGVAAAPGEVIIFVDADQIMPPDFVAVHLRAHRLHDGLVVIGPRCYLRKDLSAAEVVSQLAAGLEHPPVSEPDHRERFWAVASENMNDLATAWHCMFTCNVSVRKEHLVAVGGFDENFVGWGLEDSELGYRLKRHGLLFAWQPAAVTYDEHVLDSARDTDAYYEQWRTNLFYFTTKHPEPEAAVQWVLNRTNHPQNSDLRAADAFLRFEYASRALAGRLPQQTRWQLIEITEADLSDVPARLPERVASGPCIVFDWTDDVDLPIRVQTTETPHDLMYFRAPDKPARESLLARFGVSSAISQ